MPPVVEPVRASEPVRRQAMARLTLDTTGRGFVDITRPLGEWIAELQAEAGLMTVFLQHTSASLTIQENADPRVLADLLDALDALAPEHRAWRHRSEGSDDMPAHVRTMITSVSLTVPVLGGALDLGTWQAIYLVEHRLQPRTRTIKLCYCGL